MSDGQGSSKQTSKKQKKHRPKTIYQQVLDLYPIKKTKRETTLKFSSLEEVTEWLNDSEFDYVIGQSISIDAVQKSRSNPIQTKLGYYKVHYICKHPRRYVYFHEIFM